MYFHILLADAGKEPTAAAVADVTQPQEVSAVPDQTTLIPNEAEAFALEPIDVTSLGRYQSVNSCGI